MATEASAALNQQCISVALIGNPNTGKSTLFNALAGLRQRVGNYPGVTVEKRVGYFEYQGTSFALIDLPGTYSLTPRSPDEMLVVQLLLGKLEDQPPPDVILCIVDASNLERNLYLVSQLLELGRPVVVALNMIDLAEKQGLRIDAQRLSQRLGVPVVPVQANRRRGLEELKQALLQAREAPPPDIPEVFPQPVEEEAGRLRDQLQQVLQWREQSEPDSAFGPLVNGRSGLPLCLARRILLDVGGFVETTLLPPEEPVRQLVRQARDRLRQQNVRLSAVEAVARYDWIHHVLQDVVHKEKPPVNWTDRVDRVLTHRVWGTLVLALVMLAVFISIFRLAQWPMDWIDSVIATFGQHIAQWLPEGPLRSLLVDGVLGGVGAVLVFLPQIALLFFFIGLLEDCGYMARAAYLMDRLMSSVGLSGKSFIPLLSSFACAVPGIMAARVIENPRDRLATILVAPLMSCSARLPVYTILIAAFVPTDTLLGSLLPALVLLGMYVLGIVVAMVVAWTLKRTLLRGETPPFVMELPLYKFPSLRVIGIRVWDRAWAFLRRAGTIIFAVSILVWFLSYYPRDRQVLQTYQGRIQALENQLVALPEDSPRREELQLRLQQVQARMQSQLLRHSALGRMGRAVEPVVRPLGWDWRIGCAVVASFPAREVVITVMGVIYNLGEIDPGEEQAQSRLTRQLRSATWEGTTRPVFNLPVALSIMVFFALCAQCASTLAIIAKETGHWKWSVFAFGYMTVLAYLGALITYQVGMLFV